jgi:glycosyltransferase involved in cell wall biosynthesis
MSSITIVIGNYNYDRFLREAIDSALAQQGAEARVEVLVIDDGSTDRSREIIESYGERITMVFKENEGQSSVYNLGLALVKTEYVLFLDSDDVLYPTAASEVLCAFAGGDYVKVQFRLDVIGEAGERGGAFVPHSMPPGDCAALLRRGWLYPSPPASGNAYRVSALRSVFPIPMSKQHRKAADFFAIYAIALTGRICALSTSFGGYRVHRKAHANSSEFPLAGRLAIGNSENETDLENSFPWRWETLREMIRTRLGEDLPQDFIDFSYEKSRFCVRLYGAPMAARWHWLMFGSSRYFYSVVRNPFWGTGKKIGVIGITLLCFAPYRVVSNFAVRYISSPAARQDNVQRG